MRNHMHRRTFLAAMGAGLSVALRQSFSAQSQSSSTPSAEKLGWSVGCALYTFRRFPFYEALDTIAALGFRCVEPGFFLPLDRKAPGLTTSEKLPESARKEMKARMRDHGMQMRSFYADLTKDPAQNRKVFDFAEDMGAECIVAEPPPEALDGIEKLCEDSGINVAIHHHAKGTGSRYWDPQTIVDVCKGRSKRIGACCDTGHWVRSGLNPVECLKKLEGRIVSLHLKDVIESGKVEARDVPLGTGKANFGAVLKEVHRQGFKGLAVIEYEHDSEKLVEDVRQCLAFVEQTAASLTRV